MFFGSFPVSVLVTLRFFWLVHGVIALVLVLPFALGDVTCASTIAMGVVSVRVLYSVGEGWLVLDILVSMRVVMVSVVFRWMGIALFLHICRGARWVCY